MAVPLRLGPLTAPGQIVRRSGVRWLCEDGHLCRPGEVIAFCNVSVLQVSGPRDASYAFAKEESRDFQVALATRIGGRLRQAPDSSRGGFVDLMEGFLSWTPDVVIGQIEPPPGQPADEADGELRLLMAAGRRTTELAETRSGLLGGWYDRSRAWRVEDDGPIGTLLSLGICELIGVIRGERLAFRELFEAIEGPAQVVFIHDESLAPSTRVVAEQIRRTPAERGAIAHDLAETFAGGPVTPDGADWMFAGAVLNALQRSPATDHYPVLTRGGVRQAGPPDAILLSLRAEAKPMLRHRRLGYAYSLHRLHDAGAAFEPWLRANFDPVRRSIDDIRRDYLELIDLVRSEAPATQFLICNMMSTSGYEDIQSYTAFQGPMAESLVTMRAKDLNLMLHDLARDRGIAIVDADAIAAELGGRGSVADGVHQNGAMQTEVRAEILRILHARGVPGFTPTAVN